MKKLKELMPYIIIVVVVLLVRSFIVTPGLVNGSSMEPTLHNNELVLINKIGLNKGIDRYDIVVVKYENSTIIKRVIGLPYETVEYINDTLYIDGEIVNTKVDFEYTKDFKLTAGKNEYIVLGDNRNISKDSRIIGPVKESDIIGKVDLVLFPFSKFGKVK
jgi:signal peptidase I